ncbi:hypothetical protein MSIMFI_05351 [Mycobacterium simulans]|nr:hypothetical protein MSIMFI_05351 [Mycobacterium simulans]
MGSTVPAGTATGPSTGCWPLPLNTPVACNTHPDDECWPPVRECTLNRRRPPSSTGCTVICTSVGASSVNRSRAWMTNSAMTGHPARSPAANSMSMYAVAGTTTPSPTTWPASQLCVLVESRPVITTTWSSSTRPVTAPNNGCST